MSNEPKEPGSNKAKTPSTGYWIAIGVALGVALGAAFDNIGAGIAIGTALGAAIGAAQAQRNKNK